jgi:hypothetical protein
MENTALVVGIISTLTGAGAGFVVGTFAEFFKHRLTLKRDREARAAEQREDRLLRQNQFQRETLLALQAASESLIDAAQESGSKTRNLTREVGEAVSRLDSASKSADEVWSLCSRAFWRAEALFNTLRVRVRDRDVKLACKEFNFVCVSISGGHRDFDKFREGRSFANEKFDALQDSVGKALAALDALDESA